MTAARRPTLRANRGAPAPRQLDLVPRTYVVVATVPGGPRRGSREVIMEDARKVRAT